LKVKSIDFPLANLIRVLRGLDLRGQRLPASHLSTLRQNRLHIQHHPRDNLSKLALAQEEVSHIDMLLQLTKF
jgi:hypothetical protein